MKYLLPPYWKSFLDNNDGKLFEELCLHLLKFMYPDEEWHQTQKSWDGKKDFFADISVGGFSQIKCWAECKCHTDNLSIDVISSTLVVGTLENAGIIIFFSYSPLNENASEYLTFFKEKTGKQIIIFDDLKLEELIIKCYKECSNSEVIRDFFPEFTFDDIIKNRSSEESVYYHYFLSNPYTHNIFKKYTKDFYRVNDVFVVNHFFENTSISQKIQIKINVHYDLVRHKHLCFLNKNDFLNICQITLNPGEIKYVQCKYKLISYMPKIVLPSIEYEVNGQTFCPPQKTLKGKWIADTTLIGGNYISIVDLHKENLTAENKDSFCFSLLKGESGTGKSRLLKEICDNAIAEGYEVFRYNGEYQISNNEEWIKSFLSIVYALPYEKKSYSVLMDSYDEEKNKIVSMIYNDNYDFAAEYNIVKETILEHLLKDKQLLLFDNIQFFGDLTFQLLNDFITFANNNSCNIKIILAFNTDYVFPKTAAKKMLDRLTWLQKEANSHYFINTVSGFNKEQAEIYVRSCLNCVNTQNTYQYEETIKLLIEKTGILPLAIEQTLFYLVQKRVLTREADYFVISNLDVFHQELKKIPPSLKQVLNQRMEIISSQMSYADQIFDYISLISFMQEVDNEFLTQFGADFAIIEIMTDMGLLRYTDDETYIIYHNILKRFFKERFRQNIYKIEKDIIHIIEENDLKDDYPVQYVISKSHVKKSEDLLNFSIQQLLHNYKCSDLQKEFDAEVQKMFFSIVKEELISELHLKAAKIICYHSQIYNTYDKCIKTYNNFNDRFFNKYNSCCKYGEEFAEFIREFANVYILLRQENNCQILIDDVLSKWDKLSFKSHKSDLKMYGLLLTRKCVALKSLNILKEAENTAKKALKISQEINDDELYIRICFDYGYIYYNKFSQREKTSLYWENAFLKYEMSDQKNIYKLQGSVYFHEALVQTMFFRYTNAIKMAQTALKFFEINEKTPYYKTKLNLLLAVIYLIKTKTESSSFYECGTEYLDKAEDLAIAFHSNRIYYKCLYLRAKYFFIQESYEKCDIYLNKCLHEVYLHIGTEKEEARYCSLIYDIYYMKRFYTSKLTLYTKVKNIDVIRNIKKIYQLNNEQWINFYHNFKADSIITTESQDMNYPKP